MPKIALKLLDPDARSSNVCSSETVKKIRRNIERTKLYPPLIIRPSGERFVLIDGHHRKQVLESLGYTEAECLIWDICERDAHVALATLNTLRGTENLKKRAELLESLSQTISLDELAQLLPETSEEIQDLLKLLDHDVDELEKAVATLMADEANALPVPLTFLIAACDLDAVEKALAFFKDENTKGKPDRGVSLVSLCRFSLKQLECPDEKEE
jgi:ParB-like chromosome segregation protein Spo0J